MNHLYASHHLYSIVLYILYVRTYLFIVADTNVGVEFRSPKSKIIIMTMMKNEISQILSRIHYNMNNNMLKQREENYKSNI